MVLENEIKNSPFGKLPETIQKEIASKFTPIECSAGQEIIKEGDISHRLCVIASPGFEVTVGGTKTETLEVGK